MAKKATVKSEKPSKKTAVKAPKVIALKNRTVIRFNDYKVTVKPTTKGITVAQVKKMALQDIRMDLGMKGKQVNFVLSK